MQVYPWLLQADKLLFCRISRGTGIHNSVTADMGHLRTSTPWAYHQCHNRTEKHGKGMDQNLGQQ